MKIACPCCQNKRLFDSNKLPKVSKLSNSNENKADIIIKCNFCKNQIAVKISHVNKDSPPKILVYKN